MPPLYPLAGTVERFRHENVIVNAILTYGVPSARRCASPAAPSRSPAPAPRAAAAPPPRRRAPPRSHHPRALRRRGAGGGRGGAGVRAPRRHGLLGSWGVAPARGWHGEGVRWDGLGGTRGARKASKTVQLLAVGRVDLSDALAEAAGIADHGDGLQVPANRPSKQERKEKIRSTRGSARHETRR